MWIDPHIHHAEEEAWYVLSGEVIFRIGDDEVIAKPGSFVLAPRGKAHSFGNEHDEPARFLELFSPAGPEGYFDERELMAERSKGLPNLDYAGLVPAEHHAMARRYNIEFL
jgi:mannose-6-phosphate isomerase-like protein (cupin superfamily)